jgi:nucleoside-diphosphate-sugar epimerase
MKVVITGANGTIGRQLAAELDAHGHVPVRLDLQDAGQTPGEFVKVDLTRAEQPEAATRGADAVVHLARVPFPYTANGYDAATRTWRQPDRVGDAQRLNANLAMTCNVLAAARAAGLRKIVMGSSFAVYGLYYPSRPLLPDYLPIDEGHRRRPDDAYGLTKLLGEQLADSYADFAEMQIASLRFPGVSRESPESIAARQHDPMKRGGGGLWTYVDARDAALACRLALEADFAGHQAFNICAPNTFMNVPTDELLRRYLPGVPCHRTHSAENWAGYDSSKAARMLGFKPRYVLPFSPAAVPTTAA